MLVVIDTNILVNALMSKNENSKAMMLLDDVFEGTHTMIVSSAITEEYADVLKRPHLGIPISEVDYLLSWIDRFAVHIEPLPTTQSEVEMKDEDDRVFLMKLLMTWKMVELFLRKKCGIDLQALVENNTWLLKNTH